MERLFDFFDRHPHEALLVLAAVGVVTASLAFAGLLCIFSWVF